MSRLRSAALGPLVLALALVACGPAPEVMELVVPPGTRALLAAGERVDVMPAEITLRVGDTLRIRNDDSSRHAVGPYVVQAGETVDVTYGEPGRFEGMCSLSGGSTYVIEILP